MDQLKSILEKLPFGPLLGVLMAYLAYDAYTFSSDPSSPLVQKRLQLDRSKKEVVVLRESVKKAQEFYRTLDVKRAELRSMAQQLDEMKGSLSENLDVPAFVKRIVTEAAKVGVKVLSIKPTAPARKEYYTEQPFDLSFRAVYVQLLVFLDRVASLERVVRVDNVDFKKAGSSSANYVELSGTIQIKTYQYLGSKADDLVKSGGSK